MTAIEDVKDYTDVLCMACKDATCNFQPVALKRRALGEYDVKIAMKFCGICHTDVHIAQGCMNNILGTGYPCVPGHELAGVVSEVGSKVTKMKVGDQVGVGCMVDSCMKCKDCRNGEEQMCNDQVLTYNHPKQLERSATYPKGSRTLGGYTNIHIVHEHFAIKIPSSYPLESAGPVMCAGVTLYDPLKKYGASNGTKVAIVGMGGLGSIGVQIAAAMGCDVTAITRGANKDESCRKLGASTIIHSTDAAEMKSVEGVYDLVLNTIPVDHDSSIYTKLIKKGSGKQVILGLSTQLVANIIGYKTGLVGPKTKFVGSGIGGIRSTQEVIDLCDKHKIFPHTKTIGVDGINKAYEKLHNSNDEGIRYVIDIGTLDESAKEICSKQPAPNFTAAIPQSLACCPCCVCPPCSGYTICGAFWYNLCCGNWCC